MKDGGGIPVASEIAEAFMPDVECLRILASISDVHSVTTSLRGWCGPLFAAAICQAALGGRKAALAQTTAKVTAALPVAARTVRTTEHAAATLATRRAVLVI